MTDKNSSSFDAMSKPSKNRGGIVKLSIITLCAVALTAGGTYWLSRDNAEQKVILQKIQNNVEDVVKDTPFEPVVNVAFSNLNPLPSAVTKPRTTPGTLSGQSIHAEMSPPLKNTPIAKDSAGSAGNEKMSSTHEGEKKSQLNSANIPQIPVHSNIIAQPNGTVSLTMPTQPMLHTERKTGNAPVNTVVDNQPTSGNQSASTKQISSSPQTAPAEKNVPSIINAERLNTENPEQNSAEQKPITPTLPKVNQDSVVPLPFVDDVATWLVKRYNPKTGTNFSLGSINSRYGHEMHTLMPQGKQDVFGSRAELLRYAFNAPMLTALYGLYADRFVIAMDKAAKKEAESRKKIVPAKILSSYAAEFQALGDTLQAIGFTEDFEERMNIYEQATQNTLKIHKEITDAIHDLNMAKEKGENTKALALRVNGLNAVYQRHIHEHNLAKENLVSAIREKISKQNRMDNESILFVAKWLERRIATGITGENAIANARVAGQLLQDLSTKLVKAE